MNNLGIGNVKTENSVQGGIYREKLLTTLEMSKEISFSCQTLRKWAREDTIPCEKFKTAKSTRYRFRRSDVYAFLASLTEEQLNKMNNS